MAPPLRHDLDFDPPTGVIERLSPLVRRVVCPNPSPFTFRGTATFIVGHGDVAVIDPGPPSAAHLEALLAGLDAGERVRWIAVTHTHSDHSLGSSMLVERTGATTFGFGPHVERASEAGIEDGLEHLDFGEHISPDDIDRFRAELDAVPNEFRHEAHDLGFAPDVTLSDGDSIRGDGWTLDAVHTPGHCSNHLCYGLPEESTLSSGDHVMAWATSVISPPDGSMGDYLRSLDRVLRRNDRVLRPTHGPAIESPRNYLAALAAHRLDRERQVLDAVTSGCPRITDIVPVLYAAYDKRLWFPAAASVLAHLEKLVEDGRVATTDGAAPALSSAFAVA